MNHTPRTPIFLALSALVLSLFMPLLSPAALARREKRSAARTSLQTKSKQARVDKKRDNKRSVGKKRARETASKRGRGADKRSSSARNNDRRNRRPLSRRERLLESRRGSERRRREEIARREAARRAELARQAAIARQRALDQALRDEATANILRDETTGEDMEVRRIAVDALGNHAGTVVVMDPVGGRVYTVINQDWALRRGFKPCSTIKLVTGAAGLCEKVIDSTQSIDISTGYHRLDLTDSLAYSNNTYFQIVGGRVGFDRIMNYARQMGLGERTGINHANESAGRVPVYKTGYAVNHMCSHGDDFEVTPIQLATLVSAIANGGTLLKPHLPRTPEEVAVFKPEIRRRLNIPVEELRRLVPGMIGAVNYGTAKLAYDAMQTVAGKTGSCTGQGSKLGLFASYAPVHDPRLAVVVITRGSGERGRVAAGVAGRIYRALNHRFGNRSGAPQIATTPETLMPRPKINPNDAAIVSEEDAEADAASASDAAGTVAAPGTSQGNVKSVLKPVDIKPTEVTTKPAQPTTQQPTTGQPAAPSATLPSVQPPESARPRRVLSTSP